MAKIKVGQVYKTKFSFCDLESIYDVVVVEVNEEEGSVMARPIFFMGLPYKFEIGELKKFGGDPDGRKKKKMDCV